MTAWRLTVAARADLVRIWHYTDRNWGEDQAEAYVLQIKRDLTAAAEGSPLVQPFDTVWKIRSGHHLCIFCHVAQNQIDVIRILHERMDINQEIKRSS